MPRKIPSDAGVAAEELHALRRRIAALEAELSAERRQRELLESVGHSLELERLLQLLGDEIARLAAFDGYLITLVDRERSGLVCFKAEMPASLSGLKDTYRQFKFPFAEADANSLAFAECRPIYLDRARVEAEAGLTRRAFERWQAESMAVIPIPGDDGAIGTVIAFRQRGAIDPAAVDTLGPRLKLFSEPIRNALSYRELKRQEKEFQSAIEEHKRFLEFVSQVNNLTSPELIYEAIVKEFVRAFGFNIAAVSLAEPDGLTTKQVGCAEEHYAPVCRALREATMGRPVPLRHNESVSVIAFLQNSHVLVPDVRQLRHLPMAERDRDILELLGDLRTVLQMPIRRHNQAIGMLGLYSLDRPLDLSESDLKIIALLSSFVGTAITNAQLYSVIGNQKGQIEELNHALQEKVDKLNQLVNKDQLTGLDNFGAFKAELYRRTQEVDRGGDAAPALSLVITDVDRFKRFNDTYGHVAGNRVLQELAGRVAQLTRRMDLPARFGGEEFVVVLPSCDLEGAAQFAERLRRSIADAPFAIEGQSVTVTASFGCARYVAGETVEQFIARADQALYRAKEAGRNRVEVAD